MFCIICALEIEYRNTIKFLSVDRRMVLDGQWEAVWCEQYQWLVIRCGVGKNAAARCMGHIASHYSDIVGVISAGMAGAVSPMAKIGDIVMGSDVLDYQFGASPEEIRCDIPLSIQIPNTCCSQEKILSSSDFLNDGSLKKTLYEKYRPFCVEMESAGIARICNRENIPFAGIKVISDYADGSALKSILKMEISVTEKLGEFLSKIHYLKGADRKIYD